MLLFLFLYSLFLSPLNFRFFLLLCKTCFYNYLKTKNQVMKKIRLLVKNETNQARLVIAGFFIVFALLAIFFM